MNLALLAVTTCFNTREAKSTNGSAYTFITIVLVQFVGLILFKVFSILKQRERVRECLHLGQPVEDDWELYEQATLLREMENDAEKQESEDSVSIESLPTY